MNENAQIAAIRALMADFSQEITPKGADKVERFADYVAPGGVVAVTFLPGSDYKDTVATAARIRREGFEPAPHVAARSIRSEGGVIDFMERLKGEANVDHVVALAGGVTHPLGPYESSMDLMKTGIFEKYGISKMGVAGHPEGSPDIPNPELAKALAFKNQYQKETGIDVYIATQFVFEADPVIAWDKRIRAEGNELPIHIGVPGLATIKTLINLARASGVGPSMRFLTRQARNVTKLLTVSSPDKLVTALADYHANDAECGIRKVHMYPLGGIRRTAQWSEQVAAGDFTITPKGDFKLKTPVE